VHRDLKPSNVMLTKTGVKLLDFGLAKTAESEVSKDSSLPTQARPLTEKGTVIGTFQYMAPEQLEGRDADARSDIFSLGCVLYEMAVGQRAFTGASQAALVSAILRDEPKLISAVAPTAPPALDRLVQGCLAKDPEERWQSARDVRNELAWIARAGSQPSAPAPAHAAPRRVHPSPAWAVAIVLLLVALVAGIASRHLRARIESLERPVVASLVLPAKTAVRGVAFSPEGRRLAFVARDSSGQSRVWLRGLDSPAVTPLTGTESGSFPFWSPDGRDVAFFADGKLKRVDVAGGPVQVICDAPEARGGTWNRDGVIVFARVVDGGLFRVHTSGGSASRITNLDRTRAETSHRWPVFLPDSRHFLYLVANFATPGDQPGMGIYVRALDSGEESRVVAARSSAAYVAAGDGDGGFVLFGKDGNLTALPFDAKAGRVTGEPLPIAEDIQLFPQTQYAVFSVSGDRTLVYQARSASAVSQLLWFDRSGKQTGALGTPANHANPRISPDGKRVALDITDAQTGNTDVWIYEASGGVPTRLTTDPSLDTNPSWSPDGTRIVFMSLRRAHPDLYLKNADGSGSDQPLLVSERTKYPTDWSHDGRSILFRSLDDETNFELWSLPVGASPEPVPFLKAVFGVSHGQFSPDGRLVAYTSNESGRWEVYVSPYPGPGGNWKVSIAGGSEPRWRRDGRELFYLAPDGKLMAVAVSSGATFEAGTATPLFQTHRRERISATDLFSYDVAPDGQHFLVNTDVGEVNPSPLSLVLHWTVGSRR
jgi:Tol biopolymer transport system component